MQRQPRARTADMAALVNSTASEVHSQSHEIGLLCGVLPIPAAMMRVGAALQMGSHADLEVASGAWTRSS